MGKRPLVLTAGKNPRNLELLARFLKREGYAALDCHNLQELEETLKKKRVDLALIDIGGFGKDIWQKLELVQKKKIAFFVISSREDARIRQESIIRGARGVLTKPLKKGELLRLVKSILQV